MKTTLISSFKNIRPVSLIQLAIIAGVSLFISGSAIIDLHDQEEQKQKNKKLNLLEKLEKGKAISADEIRSAFHKSDAEDEPDTFFIFRDMPDFRTYRDLPEIDFPEFPDLPQLPDLPDLPCLPETFLFHDFRNIPWSGDSTFIFRFSDSDSTLFNDEFLKEFREQMITGMENFRKQMDIYRNSEDFKKEMDQYMKSRQEMMKEIEKLKEEIERLRKEQKNSEGKKVIVM